ncbi:MAG: hypothetical protein EP330_30280 [Deltaproteobacteria bacterium]|nr:MAG: hypothetical protein EP330_30280 [Deltaproteobacteria bacterium]
MSWDFAGSKSRASRLRAPTDGIVATGRANGWLSERWTDIFAHPNRQQSTRLGRGRSYARSGRIRDLWFSPGLANAQVIGSDEHHVSLRVRVFDDAEWRGIVKVLLSDLSAVADLLEGDLPRALIERLEAAGHSLVPTADELDGNCDCNDYVSPCEHAAGVFHILAEAVEGDPFILLTLRGRPREQLLAELRSAWGDTLPLSNRSEAEEEEPPASNWFVSPEPLPELSFSPCARPAPSAGLRALGPPPGETNLGHALNPLYEAGGAAALEIALEDRPRKKRRRGGKRSEADPVETAAAAAPVLSDAGPLTERVVNLLANRECARSRELAKELDVSPQEIRAELLELEKQGIVYRTGQTRGTRWWLG